jgi:hypothetical protein
MERTIDKKEYRRRIAEISEILSSAFKIPEKVRQELIAKQNKYVERLNKR